MNEIEEFDETNLGSSPQEIVDVKQREYLSLTSSMLKKDTENISKTIFNLVVTEKENICAFFIEFYGLFVVKSIKDLNIIYTIASKLQLLSHVTKRGLENSFADFVQVAITISQNSVQNVCISNDESDCNLDNVDTMMENYDTKRYDTLEFFHSLGWTSSDMFKILNVFYNRLKHREYNDCKDLVNFLLQKNPRAISLSDIPKGVITEIDSIKFGRNDVVWYLWKVMQIFSEKCLKNEFVSRYISYNLTLYVVSFQKKYRNHRLSLIYQTIRVICEKGKKLIFIDNTMHLSDATDEDTCEDTREDEENEDKLEYLKYFTIQKLVRTSSEL